jgi:hypothetical protein
MSNRACSVPVKLAVLSLSIVALGAAGCDGGSGGAEKYFPMKIGATWNYAVTPASGVPYTYVKQKLASSPPTLTQTYTSSNGTSSTDSYEMDANGISITGGTSTASNGGTSTASQFSYAPPCLILPSNTTPGFSTSSTSTETVQRSTNTTYTVAVAVTIDGLESVTVPAGTFSALKVTRAITSTSALTGSVSNSFNVQWRAPGIGSVKTVDEDSLQTVLVTWELTSYNIP